MVPPCWLVIGVQPRLRPAGADNREPHREERHDAPRREGQEADGDQEERTIEHRTERCESGHWRLERGDTFERLPKAADVLKLWCEI